ncbi:hypothetical protein D9M72_475360 [compost metagenome]
MPSHLFCERVNIHPPSQSRVVVPSPVVVQVKPHLVLELLSVVLIIIHKLRHGIDSRSGSHQHKPRSRILLPKGELVRVVIGMLEPERIVVAFLKNFKNVRIFRILRIAQSDVPQMVRIIIYIAVRKAHLERRGLHVAFRSREELQRRPLVVESAQIVHRHDADASRHASRGIGGILAHLSSVCGIKILNFPSC